MVLVKVDNEENNGHIIVNIENIIYIAYFKQSSNRLPYAQVYFSEGRASIVLNKNQYSQLMEGAIGIEKMKEE